MGAPAVIVHSLQQARAALAPGLPVTLLSAPGAALYGGIGWWRAMIAQARDAAARDATDILDCGHDAAQAVEALRAGQAWLVLRAPAPIFADIAERAALRGATLLAAPPPALDLAARGGARRLQAWLEGPGDTPPAMD